MVSHLLLWLTQEAVDRLGVGTLSNFVDTQSGHVQICDLVRVRNVDHFYLNPSERSTNERKCAKNHPKRALHDREMLTKRVGGAVWSPGCYRLQ